MKIKNIHLKAWQKHSDLKLDFNNDLNIITGLTDTGKTAIYRAIEWVCNFSNIAQIDYRKEGTNETSVTIVLDNGFTVERIRSNSVNRYILSKEGVDDKVFDSFNKETPEEIQKVLEISAIDIEKEHLNLNLASQDKLNFILDSYYSDTFKAKLFNKLTGNELLDKVFKEFNKESLKVNRELKDTETKIEKQEEELSEYSIKYKKLKKKLKSVQEQYAKVEEDTEIYNHLKDLADKLKTNKENQEFVDFKKSQIKLVSEEKLEDLKAKAEVLEMLEKLSASLEVVNCDIESIKEKRESIKVTKIDWDKLKAKDESLQNMKLLHKQSLQVNKDQEKVTAQIKETKSVIDKAEKELSEIWKDNPNCPLCGKEKCDE